MVGVKKKQGDGEGLKCVLQQAAHFIPELSLKYRMDKHSAHHPCVSGSFALSASFTLLSPSSKKKNASTRWYRGSMTGIESCLAVCSCVHIYMWRNSTTKKRCTWLHGTSQIPERGKTGKSRIKKEQCVVNVHRNRTVSSVGPTRICSLVVIFAAVINTTTYSIFPFLF